MEAKTAKEIFNFLPGIWKIVKRITAKMPEQNAIAHGYGYGLFIVSKKNPNFISYSEQVSIHYLKSNTTHIGKQQYIYLYDTVSLSLSKYFHDGRLFYRLHLQDGQINGTHVCMEDKYLSTYIFKKDGFSITYSVNGPLKSYEITTIYTKLPSYLFTTVASLVIKQPWTIMLPGSTKPEHRLR